jgi:hypothetical protein
MWNLIWHLLHMLSTQLQTAFKGIKSNKTFSFVNIFGLTLGLATCMIAATVIIDALSYDRQWSKAPIYIGSLRSLSFKPYALSFRPIKSQYQSQTGNAHLPVTYDRKNYGYL